MKLEVPSSSTTELDTAVDYEIRKLNDIIQSLQTPNFKISIIFLCDPKQILISIVHLNNHVEQFKSM